MCISKVTLTWAEIAEITSDNNGRLRAGHICLTSPSCAVASFASHVALLDKFLDPLVNPVNSALLS